uniref:Uncharacterized protein n=1 Tax=Anguilla anguilla TaxID=7936 RepID=A0A0E9RVC1_ANGAN
MLKHFRKRIIKCRDYPPSQRILLTLYITKLTTRKEFYFIISQKKANYLHPKLQIC